VAVKYSIHLALELVWSHTADLEESLQPANFLNGSAYAAASSVYTCSTHCRRRRFAVLRFLCELESLLFDFDGGWGGGSVCLGKMLQPTTHQLQLMKRVAHQLVQALLRSSSDNSNERRRRLSRSARWDLLSVADRRNRPPEEQAAEKLRIARHADYYSCHLNFSKRLADIAEKLRFMDLTYRAGALEEELNLLNASGTMGGDPLNKIRDYLIRVVRVPSTEGHVFRSKERTPVLLLMEIIDEQAEEESEREEEDKLFEQTQVKKESDEEMGPEKKRVKEEQEDPVQEESGVQVTGQLVVEEGQEAENDEDGGGEPRLPTPPPSEKAETLPEASTEEPKVSPSKKLLASRKSD
jgi:hypothetical protein